MTTLRDLTVLVTRPDPAGSTLCKLIEAAAGRAVRFSTLTFSPPTDKVALNQAVAAVGHQDWLIFTSPRAVETSLPLIRRAWPSLPASLQWAAIGEETANTLKTLNLKTTITYPPTAWTSEGLLALSDFQTIPHQKIMIIRGEGGRKYLEQTLKQRGAIVTSMVVYRRRLPETNIDPLVRLLKENTIHVMICTSFEGLQNLKKMIPPTYWNTLCQLPMITVSERIKMLAQGLDFQTIWIARNASHPAILTALAQKRDELCQMKMK